MQLGHYAERDIINLKSNQLQREKKFQVLYSNLTPYLLFLVRSINFILFFLFFLPLISRFPE